MSRWFRIDTSLLDDQRVQRLPADAFKAEVLKSFAGQPSMFSAFIRGPYTRPLTHEWRAIRDFIFRRDDYTCRYCGARGGKLECDHIIPVARGGSSEHSNLATACKRCNQSKKAKLLSEWRPT